jgi:chemotaxis protein MotB
VIGPVVSDSGDIIIKKVKKVTAAGHHGGAWKVAYADFVTAMMAFFLLMWLLNATTEDQRKGIADYFNPSIPISPISGGGSGMLNGSTVYSDKTLAKDGTGGAKAKRSGEEVKTNDQENPEAAQKSMEDADNQAAKTLDALREEIFSQFDGEETAGLARHILTRVTPEGIVIELVDVDGSPLFGVGSTDASPTMRLLLEVVTSSLSMVSNNLSIVGHTDGLAYSGVKDYTNWELSTDRAHQARRLMLDAGFPASQISQVAGKADTDPLVKDRLAPQNRRISITILKS